MFKNYFIGAPIIGRFLAIAFNQVNMSLTFFNLYYSFITGYALVLLSLLLAYLCGAIRFGDDRK